MMDQDDIEYYLEVCSNCVYFSTTYDDNMDQDVPWCDGCGDYCDEMYREGCFTSYEDVKSLSTREPPGGPQGNNPQVVLGWNGILHRETPRPHIDEGLRLLTTAIVDDPLTGRGGGFLPEEE